MLPGKTVEPIRLGIGELTDNVAPREEVVVVAEDVVFRCAPGGSVLGIEEVEREVATDDVLFSDVGRCFHRRSV
jgi:hypothetical protein